MKNPPKKCPVCNSSRVSVSKEGFECKRCGYLNRELSEKELEE